MDYNTIKLKAKQQAEAMHDEWLADHFTGLSVSDDEVERTRYEEDPEHDYAAELKRKLILGELLPDEVEDSLAFILYKQLQAKSFDEWRNPEKLLRGDDVEKTVTQPIPEVRFSENIEAFFDDKKMSKSVSANTTQAYRDSFQSFIEVMGDRVVSELTYRDGTKYRDLLAKLPPNRKKNKAYRDKSVAELLSMNIPREQCLKSKTIKDTLIYIKTYWAWMVKAGLASKNPFDGVNIEVEMVSYTAYTIEDLNKIFQSPLFLLEGDYISRAARRSYWWLIVIATYTGARISEIVQLTTKDIVTKDEVFCFSLIDEEQEKRLKSKAARRIIPIHSKLLELGLLQYTDELKAKGRGRLLPGIQLAARRPGKAASDWYNERYRGAYLTEFKEQRKVFHSFRHTFIQEAIKRDVDMLKLQSMVGHEPALMGTTKTYKGKAAETYTGKQLSEQIERIQFDGIKLEHLDWRGIQRE